MGLFLFERNDMMVNSIFKTYEVTVDTMRDSIVPQNMRYSQNDLKSAKILININHNGNEEDFSEATAVRVSFEKGDKKIVYQDCQPINVLEGKYQVLLTTQTLTSVGIVTANVHIYFPDDKKIETGSFKFEVVESKMSDEVIESTDSLPVIQKAIEAGEKLSGVDIPALVASKETAEQAKVAAEQNAAQIGILSNNVAAVNIENFGAKPNGEDISKAIQDALNYAMSNNIPVVKSNGGATYKLEKIIDLPNNIHFDGGNSLFLFENKSGVTINPQEGKLRQSWRGVFSIWGSELTDTTTDLLGYENTTDMTDFAELRVVNGNNLTGRWKVGSAVNFNRGDFVKVYVPFRGQTFNQYFPVTEVLAKVIEVDKTNNYIYTDYYSPFDYKNYTWRTGTDVMVKVEPKKNVSISNIRIQDISPNKNRPPLGQAITDGQNRHLFPCGIGIAYGFNINISNVQFENMKFSGVTNYFTHTFHLDGVIMDSPNFVGPGEGYANQNMNVMNGVIEGVRGYGAPRHLVDISSGAFVHVRDCMTSAITNSAFDLHGEGEHDILYDNCVGSFAFGNGVKNFNDIGHNITIRKSKGRLMSTGYTTNLIISKSDISFVDSTGAMVTDSEGTTKTPTNSPQITIKDSIVTLRSGNKFEKVGRGRTDASWFKLINCEVKAIFDSANKGGFGIVGYDKVIIESNETHDMSQGFMFIAAEGSKRVIVKGNDFKDTIVFALNKGVPFIDYSFEGNLYEFTDAYNSKLLNTYDIIIRTDGLDAVTGSLKVIKNTIHSKRTTGKVQNFLFVDAGKNVDSDLHLILKDNVLQADNPSMLRASVNDTVTTIKLTASDNHFYANVNKKPFTNSKDLGLRYFENTPY